MTGTFFTDDAREKVRSFQKITIFLQYEIFHRDLIHSNLCLFEDYINCRNLEEISFKVLQRYDS